ncbi:MAG: hypothetical protein ACI81R_003886 [Bradymonadia bacterium]|jgi:hypothetical protein
MNYIFLIYSDEKNGPPKPTNEAEFAKMMEPWGIYNKALKDAGVMRGGQPLHPTTAASTVTVTDGETVITDGPFAETREQLGGYYAIECDNLDDAMHWASQCPIVNYGRVEVRPIMDLG